jgi:hypothetical protein
LPLARLKTEGEPYYEDPLDDPDFSTDNLLVKAYERYAFGAFDTRALYGSYPAEYGSVAAPHVWIPKPSLLVAAAAATVIVRNPIVTRRFWMGWR